MVGRTTTNSSSSSSSSSSACSTATAGDQHASILQEFIRELDAFTATRSVELAALLSSQRFPSLEQNQLNGATSALHADLERICWFCQVLATKDFHQLVTTQLNWSPNAEVLHSIAGSLNGSVVGSVNPHANPGAGTGTGTAAAGSSSSSSNQNTNNTDSTLSNVSCHGRIALWLTAHVLIASLKAISFDSFHDRTTGSGAGNNQDSLSFQVFAKSLDVFQQINLLQQKTRLQQQSSNSFFGSFKASSSIKLPSKQELALCDQVHKIWKQLIAKWCESSGGSCLQAVKSQLTEELAKPGKQVVATRDFFLSNFTELRLGLVHSESLALLPTTSSFRANSCAGSIQSHSVRAGGGGGSGGGGGGGGGTFVERIKEATSFLRSLMVTLTKANKIEVRKAGLELLSCLFQNELDTIDALQDERALRAIYNVNMSEWSCLLSDLHALCMKTSSSKKEFLVIWAWKLRIQVVCMAGNELFARYWRDDAETLLKTFRTISASLGSGTSAKEKEKTHAKAVQLLNLVCFFLQNVLKRHFVSDRRVPMESEVMDFMNIIQAWGFSIPKYSQQQAVSTSLTWTSTATISMSMVTSCSPLPPPPLTSSFGRVYQSFLVVLKQLSIEIASFNLNYCVQNHVKRLLLESSTNATAGTKSSSHDPMSAAAAASLDEKKLVGLETFVYLFDQLEQRTGSMTANPVLAAAPNTTPTSLGASSRGKPVGSLFYYQLMDFKVLKSSSTRRTIAEIVGQVLVECHTHFGSELLLVTEPGLTGLMPGGSGHSSGINNNLLSPSNSAASSSISSAMLRQEYRQAVGHHIFMACLQLVKHLFSEMDMKDDQKLMVIVRCLIHCHEGIRLASQEVVQQLILQRNQGGAVVKTIVEYALRLSPHEHHALLLFMRQLKAIVTKLDDAFVASHVADEPSSSSSHTPSCEQDQDLVDRGQIICLLNAQDKRDTLLQIEAICVYMLTNIDAQVRLTALETLRRVQVLRAHEAVHEQLALMVMDLPRMADATNAPLSNEIAAASWSVADYLDTLELELDQMFCCLDNPNHQADDSANPGTHEQDHDKVLWRLARQQSFQSRNGFRWSMVLSTILPRLCQLFPQVTARFWSEIHDKTLQLEPALPVLSEMTSFDDASAGASSSIFNQNSFNAAVVQWRNLAILATSTAKLASQHLSPNPIHSPGSPSTSPSTTHGNSGVTNVIASDVRTLLKRLARFIKSSIAEHRKAAILALGSLHPTCTLLLIEILTKYEDEAFSLESWTTTNQQTMTSTPSLSNLENIGSLTTSSSLLMNSPFAVFTTNSSVATTNKKLLKVLKAKNQKLVAQIHLQHALGRIYRLLLEKQLLSPRSQTGGDHEQQHQQQQPEEVNSTTNAQAAADQVLCTKGLEIVDKLYHSLEIACHGGIFMEANATFFMMQQDFCGCLEVLLYQSHLLQSCPRNVPTSVSAAPGTSDDSKPPSPPPPQELKTTTAPNEMLLRTKDREKWFMTLVDWSQGFQFLANESFTSVLASKVVSGWACHSDVFGNEYSRPHGVLLWHWVDDFPSGTTTLAAATINPSTPATTGSNSSSGTNNNDPGTNPEGTCGGNGANQCDAQELAAFQRFFLCQSAFSAMKMLLYGPLFQKVGHENAIFQWLDACFAIDPRPLCLATSSSSSSSHGTKSVSFDSLQFLCQEAVEALLLCQGNDQQLVNFCVDKTLAVCLQPRVARHYFQAITRVAQQLQRELLDVCDMSKLLLACLIHIGPLVTSSSASSATMMIRSTLKSTLEPNQTANAVGLLHLLLEPFEEVASMDETTSCGLPSGFLLNSTLANEVTWRKQLLVAKFCANYMPEQSVAMILTMLRLVASAMVTSTLQKRLLALCLPWISQIDLMEMGSSTLLASTSCGDDDAPARNATTCSGSQEDKKTALLGLLFRLTSNLHESCAEQLEQVWVALSSRRPGATVVRMRGINSKNNNNNNNLFCILQFLLCQRIGVRVSTSKLILWWLVKHLEREQDKDQVLRILLTQLAVSSCSSHALDDLAVTIVLMKEWSWALGAPSLSSQARSLTVHEPSASTTTKEFAVQLLHSVLLMLYTLVIEPNTNTNPTVGTPAAIMAAANTKQSSGSSVVTIPCWSQLKATTSPDKYQETLFVDIFHDVLVLLRHVLTQMDGSELLVQSIYEDFASICAHKMHMQCATTHAALSPPPPCTKSGTSADSLAQLLQNAMQRLVTCLTNSERTEWTEECVLRFMKSMSLASNNATSTNTSTSTDRSSPNTNSTCSSLNSLQQKYEVRFCLLVYRCLAPAFDGEVLVSLMALLQKALNDVAAPSMVPLIQDILHTLSCLVDVMQTSKLTLYPQILWVCVALLNHCKMLKFLKPTMQLLHQILCKPNFCDPFLQDVLACKRPSQWQPHQGTILFAIVQGMYDPTTLQLALQMTWRLLLVGSEAICVSQSALDHAVLSTALFLPTMSVFLHDTNHLNSTITATTTSSSNDDEQQQHYPQTLPEQNQSDQPMQLDVLEAAEQIAFVWQKLGFNQLSNAFLQFSKKKFLSSEQFMLVLAPHVVQLLGFAASSSPPPPQMDASTSTKRCELFFDVLVRVLNSGDDETCVSTLKLLEELLLQGQEQRLWWRSQSHLVASLVRIVRSPQQTRKWHIAVRILANCEFDASTSTNTSTSTSGGTAATSGNEQTSKSPGAVASASKRPVMKKTTGGDVSVLNPALSGEPIVDRQRQDDNQSCAR